MKLRSPADRWFAEFNPLYFASALCVLGGVFLAACELPPDQFLSKLGIAAGVQGYQLLLIAGAWLLLRAGLKRPATILGLLAVLFVLDVTLDGERVFSHVGTLSLAPGMRARKGCPPAS